MTQPATIAHATALFSYQAEADSELSLVQGHRLEVLEMSSSGWWLAKNTQGLAGWIPSNYLSVENTSTAPAHASDAPVAATISASDATPAVAEVAALAQQLANANLQSDAAASAEPIADTVSQLNSALAAVKTCHQCKQILGADYVTAKHRHFHVDHFQCHVCNTSLSGQAFIERDDQFFCEADYHAKYSPKCAHCQTSITGKYISALDQKWHSECFVCTVCQAPFVNDRFRKHENKPYCDQHYAEMFGPKCNRCSQVIADVVFEAVGKKFHLACFVCDFDAAPIGEGNSFHHHQDKIYCPQHFQDLFLQKCQACNKSISGQFIRILDKMYHPECWKCGNCEKPLHDGTFDMFETNFVCKECADLIDRAKKEHNTSAPAPAPAPAPAATAPAPAAPPAAAAPSISVTPTPVPVPASPVVALAPAPASSSPAASLAPPRPGRHRHTATLEQLPSLASLQTTKQEVTTEQDTIATFYDYQQLLALHKLPPNVDPRKRETYLSEDDFVKIFKMNKAEFATKKAWQQEKLKKDANLW